MFVMRSEPFVDVFSCGLTRMHTMCDCYFYRSYRCLYVFSHVNLCFLDTFYGKVGIAVIMAKVRTIKRGNFFHQSHLKYCHQLYKRHAQIFLQVVSSFASIAFGYPNSVCLGRTQTPGSRIYMSRTPHTRRTAS